MFFFFGVVSLSDLFSNTDNYNCSREDVLQGLAHEVTAMGHEADVLAVGDWNGEAEDAQIRRFTHTAKGVARCTPRQHTRWPRNLRDAAAAAGRSHGKTDVEQDEAQMH